jgi:hypothetical protein
MSLFQELTMCARLGFHLAILLPRLLRSELGSLKQRSRWLRSIRTRPYLAQLTCKTLLHLQIFCVFKFDELLAFAIKEPVRSHRFLLKQNQQLSGEVLTTFVEDFIEGKLMPAITSEPVPETQQGPDRRLHL